MSALDNWTWKPDPDYTRLMKALRRQGQADWVPFLELFADPEIVGAFLGEPTIPKEAQDWGRESQEQLMDQRIRFWHLLGYDAFWQSAILPLPGLFQLKTDDTAFLPRTRRSWVNEKACVITSWRDFERYPWPRTQDADFYLLEYASRNLPDGMAIMGLVPGALEPVTWLMGYETLAMSLYDQPDLVEALFEKIAEIYLPVAQAIAQIDRVAALWMGDDMGFRTGTLISPQHLRKYVFPYQKRVAAIAHEQGKPFLLHSCGNLQAVMEDLIEDVGIDAKHSFEDVIQPVESFARQYGRRIGVIGGVDVDLLARGSEEQVRARTRQILEACAPGGGYVLGSGNSIANYIPLRNFLAMVDEGWRYNTRGLL
jgi:uroporphyrinogen decarboxylase